ncbi:FkbM family methyltransferase [Polluticoccus soli]|uniref:FkbM family methyltransferase n=1 Tax=Polluticoccus soli TaxID=3034150 RepID=UPI0023E2F36D|nr:FkbM family methyltransferase [Flavipsychrobacter sp. JY13-12]
MRSLLRKPFRKFYYSLYGKQGKCVVINDEKYRVSAHIARGVNSVIDETPYKILKNLVANASVVFDIGANVGIISVLLAKAMKPRTKIYSFEPVPSTFVMLADNARVQDGNAAVIANNLAISNGVGDIFFTNRTTHTINNILRSPEQGAISVKATTVDVFCKENNVTPNVIKVDVEGAEFFALEGMTKTLQQNDCIVLVEIHKSMLADFGVDKQKFVLFLERIGYHLYNESGNQIAYDEILNHTCVVLSSRPLESSMFSI